MERLAVCPACERPVRVTDAELFAKRSFCARCDAEFDLVAGMVHDLAEPYREAATALTLAPPQPPRAELVVTERSLALTRPAATKMLFITPGQQFAAPTGMLFVVAAQIARQLESSASEWILLVGGGACIAAFLGLGLREWLRLRFARDSIEIRDGALWYRKAALWKGRWQRIPLTSIRHIVCDSRTAPRYCVRIETGPTNRRIILLDGLGHDEEAVLWIVDWLKEAVRAAITADAPPALPAG